MSNEVGKGVADDSADEWVPQGTVCTPISILYHTQSTSYSFYAAMLAEQQRINFVSTGFDPSYILLTTKKYTSPAAGMPQC